MRTLTKILLILLIPSLCMGAQIIRYVDTDESTGTQDGTTLATAYDCLNDAIVNEAQDLTDAGGDYMTIYCYATGGTADVNQVNVNGFTTAAANYVEIIGINFPSDGIYSTSVYRLELTNVAGGLQVSDNHVRLINLQIKGICTGANNAYGVNVGALAAGSDVRIDTCIIEGSCSSTGEGVGIYANSASNANITAWNCTVYGWASGADTGFAGVKVGLAGTLDAYNLTVYGCYYGAHRSLAGTLNVTNCIIGNCTDDINGTVTADYCCTKGSEGTNAAAPASLDWDNELTDANSGDFRIVASGNCDDGGTDSPSALYSDDITGTSRVSVWDIGAYEVEGAAPASGQVFPAIIVKAIREEPLWPVGLH